MSALCATIPLYQLTKENNRMTKWDTIQADVADQYVYLDEVEDVEEEDEQDFFGFSKAIQLDHLTDEQIDTLLTTIEWN